MYELFTTVHMWQLADHYHGALLLPLPVQSSDTVGAAGYNSKFYIDQCQPAESNRLQLSRNWKCMVKQLPLWRRQCRGAAIGWSCWGCNWCCLVAAAEVGATRTTETFPLIGPAWGHGPCHRATPPQPLQVPSVSSDKFPDHRSVKLSGHYFIIYLWKR